MKTNGIGRTAATAGLALAVFLAAAGLLYTLAVTGLGQLLFPRQANGSVIEAGGRTYGSELLGQPFTGEEYLWGRVMNIDTGTFSDEDGRPVLYAWASNLSPASPEYEALVSERVEALRAAHPERGDAAIPVDLVTGSGSGLDPDISPAAAEYQVVRIARARGVSEAAVRDAVRACTAGRLLGIFGEPRVNVLKVNLALDGILAG